MSAPQVLRMSNGLEVSRIDTRWLSAQMVDMKTGRDWADLLFIHGPVGESRFPPNLKPDVSANESVSDCDPAWTDESSILLTPEIIRNGLSALEISDMSADESHRATFHMSEFGIRHPRDRGQSSTAALTDPRGVRRSGHRAAVTDMDGGVCHS